MANHYSTQIEIVGPSTQVQTLWRELLKQSCDSVANCEYGSFEIRNRPDGGGRMLAYTRGESPLYRLKDICAIVPDCLIWGGTMTGQFAEESIFERGMRIGHVEATMCADDDDNSFEDSNGDPVEWLRDEFEQKVHAHISTLPVNPFLKPLELAMSEASQ